MGEQVQPPRSSAQYAWMLRLSGDDCITEATHRSECDVDETITGMLESALPVTARRDGQPEREGKAPAWLLAEGRIEEVLEMARGLGAEV